MILFIASMLVAASVAGVFTETVGELSNAIDRQGGEISKDVRSDIEIISDSGSDAVFDDTDGNITLHVKNTGSSLLSNDTEQIVVFVEGRPETAVNSTLMGGATSWRPSDVLKLEIDPQSASVSTGDDVRVKVVVNGDEEVFRFRA
jgi:flagellar protein FlaG